MGTRNERVQAFLRWPGGKRQLATRIVSRFPDSYGRYFEPFLGSGAIFFHALPFPATLSDLNADLINTYRAIRNNVEDIIRWLEKQKQHKSAYYRIRSLAPGSDVEKAARFLYLNRTAFNGIWRVNRNGIFNVPYGYRPREDLVTPELLRTVSKRLRSVRLVNADFESVLHEARSGDLIYADPPYTVVHENNGFRKYNEVLFSWKDQQRLASILHELVSKGVFVIVSNAHDAAVTRLYKGFQKQTLNRPSTVAGSAANRTQVKEALFISC